MGRNRYSHTLLVEVQGAAPEAMCIEFHEVTLDLVILFFGIVVINIYRNICCKIFYYSKRWKEIYM